jgi:hypothetical protein
MGTKVDKEAIEFYKNDTKTLARWLDIGIVKRQGRAYENENGIFSCDADLILPTDAMYFPEVKGTNLNNEEVTVLGSSSVKATLVCFSFKQYGFGLIRSWIDPFIGQFEDEALVTCREICFVEYGFMGFAKSIFTSNLKKSHSIDRKQFESTLVAFGGVMEFAASMLLPNKYTGYAFLVDSEKRVRWKGSGQATDEEIKILLECTRKLVAEE